MSGEPNPFTKPTADPDVPCLHPDFDVNVDVARVQKSDDDPSIVAFMAEIKVWCQVCGEQFRWTGVRAGMSYGRPTCSPDEAELRAPLRPASADPDFGMGLPGFSIGFRPGPAGGERR